MPSGISARLDANRSDIEHGVLKRTLTVFSPNERAASTGLHRAIAEGVRFGLTGIERGEDQAGPVPAAVPAEARRAARRGVALSTVLRAFFVAYTSFCELTAEVLDCDSRDESESRRRTRVQAALFERILAAVADEYGREAAHRNRLPESRAVTRVKELLAGEAVDNGDLAYDFDEWHIGAVARGAGAASSLRLLAEAVDRRLLLVRPTADLVWAWFGGRRKIEVDELAGRISRRGRARALISLGEPARGIEGWRLSHQQADAAFRIAGDDPAEVIRYADVGLLASISRDDVLARSLHQLYLAPLIDDRNGEAYLQTLRAYFNTGRNISSAASALNVSRQTVGSRLRAIEGRLGRTIESCAAEIEVALRLERLGSQGHASPAPGA